MSFPNKQILTLPPKTAAAIAESKAAYEAPLWIYRAERVLKLGSHQWIFPTDVATAYSLYTAYPNGIIATAWKLFNRGWNSAAEAYLVDTDRYPTHPRHFGENVMMMGFLINGIHRANFAEATQEGTDFPRALLAPVAFDDMGAHVLLVQFDAQTGSV
ncbi:hypothetical protein KFU94_41080 [Chloroflexi bacterium TSY]|nr:hypothetical protein [Chloroflexi bacterium TSY]